VYVVQADLDVGSGRVGVGLPLLVVDAVGDLCFLFFMLRPPRLPTLFPYTTLFRSGRRTSRTLSSTARRRSCSPARPPTCRRGQRSEEHTSELQSRSDLVCRLLLEKKKARPA